LDALAGADVEADASALVNSLRVSIDTLSATQLWTLGLWDANHGELAEGTELLNMLERKADAGERDAALMANGLFAHLAVANGDTAMALQILVELTPNAPHYSHLQRAFESLGYERLVRARLLLGQGKLVEARAVAAGFDSPGAASIVFPIFLPASLELRLRIGRALGDHLAVRRIRERLILLGREDLLDPQ
jgi:hypothetical protein